MTPARRKRTTLSSVHSLPPPSHLHAHLHAAAAAEAADIVAALASPDAAPNVAAVLYPSSFHRGDSLSRAHAALAHLSEAVLSPLLPLSASPLPVLRLHEPSLALLASVAPRLLCLPFPQAAASGENASALPSDAGEVAPPSWRLRAHLLYAAARAGAELATPTPTQPPSVPHISYAALAPPPDGMGPLSDYTAYPPQNRASAHAQPSESSAPAQSAIKGKDATAVRYAAQLSRVPPRVAARERRAVGAAFAPQAIQGIALVTAFAGFYGTLTTLLGIEEDLLEATSSGATTSSASSVSSSMASSSLTSAQDRLRSSLNFAADALDAAHRDDYDADGTAFGEAADWDGEDFNHEGDYTIAAETPSKRRLRKTNPQRRDRSRLSGSASSGGRDVLLDPSQGNPGARSSARPGAALRMARLFGAGRKERRNGHVNPRAEVNHVHGPLASSLSSSSSGRVPSIVPSNAESATTSGRLSGATPAVAPEKIATHVSKASQPRFGSSFKLKSATRAIRLAESRWMSDVPRGRNDLDYHFFKLCGFVPEYTRQVRCSDDRRVFALAMAYLCQDGTSSSAMASLSGDFGRGSAGTGLTCGKDSVGLPPALKHLMCYVIARSTENPVLAPHAAFLAVRYGADSAHLAAACDYALLLDLRDDYAARRRRSERAAGRDRGGSEYESAGNASSDRSGAHRRFDDRAGPRGPLSGRDRETPMRRPRSSRINNHGTGGGNLGDLRKNASPAQNGLGSSPAASPSRRMMSDLGADVAKTLRPLAPLPRNLSFSVETLPDDEDQNEDEELLVAPSAQQTDIGLLAPDPPRPHALEPDSEPVSPGRSSDDLGEMFISDNEDDSASDSGDSCDSSLQDGARADSDLQNCNSMSGLSTSNSSLSGDESPQLPELEVRDGPMLPCVPLDDEDSEEDDVGIHRHVSSSDDDDDEGDYDHHIPLPRADRAALLEAMRLFPLERDVEALLLAHAVARSAKRSSLSAGHAIGRPRLGSKDVDHLVAALQPREAVEAITVVAVHTMLHRWTVAYPYLGGAMETAVRRFAQGPSVANLDVCEVGQRRTVSRMDSDCGTAWVGRSARANSSVARRMLSSL